MTKSKASRTLKHWIRQHRESPGGMLADWTILPIEYKRGQPKKNDCDSVQLCAQALCLEEMLQLSIEAGFLFYGQKQQRFHIPFDNALRSTTKQTIQALHELSQSGQTPPAEYSPKCLNCSLYDLCLPKTFQTSSIRHWLANELK